MASTGNKLRALAHKTLTEEQCTFLKATIRRFRETHSVLGLCISLKKIIDSPENVHLLPYISAMVPPHLQNDFENLCQLQFSYYRPKANMLERKTTDQRNSKQKSNESNEEKLCVPVEAFYNQRNSEATTVSDDLDCFNCYLSRRKNSSTSGDRSHGLHKRSKTFHTDTSGGGCVTAREQSIVSNSITARDQRPESYKQELIQKLLDSNHEMVKSESEDLLGEDKMPKDIKVRKVVLSRKPKEALGFSIRGGKDLKAGIFISEVDSGGQAEQKGLKVGERILKVNDEVFKDVTHAQAVVCLKSAQSLALYVARLGEMPGGTPNSTPRNSSEGTFSSRGSHNAGRKSLSKHDGFQKMVVMADEDGWLGFSIRGGIDQGIEPCVAHVDPQSPASRAGLIRGMKIYKVNETLVLGMNHLDMVQLVTVSRVVVLHISQGFADDLTSTRSVKKKDLPGTSQQLSSRESGNKTVDESFFLKDLEFTPPMHSSTPLPPAGQPLLLDNSKKILHKFMRRSSSKHDATIVQVMKDDAKNLPSKSNIKIKKRKDKQGSTSMVVTPMEEGENRGAAAKLDGGTIRLNLVGESKAGSSNTQGDKHRLHVKNIFTQSNTPATNILSTPILSPKCNQWSFHRHTLSPSSSDLKDAQLEAARQLKGELTGKHQPIPFTPNVPPSPTKDKQAPSPGVTLSKIFSKITRRSMSDGLVGGNLSDNRDGFYQQVNGTALMTSPYEMMSDSKLVSNDS